MRIDGGGDQWHFVMYIRYYFVHDVGEATANQASPPRRNEREAGQRRDAQRGGNEKKRGWQQKGGGVREG